MAFRKCEKEERPYNILPLHFSKDSNSPAQLEEVEAAVIALRQMDRLKWPNNFRLYGNMDIFDWLERVFGFQTGSVSNQREHLVCLLADQQSMLNPQLKPTKLDEKAVDAIMTKLFMNYKKWCKFLGRETVFMQREAEQQKLLYVGLYLLIWGEAANLSLFLDYTQMASQVNNLLAGDVNTEVVFEEKEAFLRDVITPIYLVVEKEASRYEKGTTSHSDWANYDDLNEYFWSPECFSLQWPILGDAEFFKGKKRLKSFCETRSFWKIYHNFNRFWIFYILTLQAMIILAFKGVEPSTVYDFSSLFVTATFLSLLQGLLDIILFQRWKLRSVLKIIVTLFWGIVLPSSCDVFLSENIPGNTQQCLSVLPKLTPVPPFHILVLLYLLPNLVASITFIFPMVQRIIENSEWRLLRLLSWWSQPGIYVGRGIHETVTARIKYTLFWVLLFGCKFAFSYFLQVKLLVKPTQTIMRIRHVQYKWPEILFNDEHNYGAVVSLWLPVILVYFLDTQVWYVVFSIMCGGIIGVFDRLGEIRTLEMLSSRFKSLPGAFITYLVPSDKTRKRPVEAIEPSRIEAAKFSVLWNEIICSFREEHLISNREENLLRIPYSVHPTFKPIQWPPFLLANKPSTALNLMGQFRKNSDLWEYICTDNYMKAAVIECYNSLKFVVNTLITRDKEHRVIESIMNLVEKTPATLDLAHLAVMYPKTIELLEILNDPHEGQRQTVVGLLQDIFEVAQYIVKTQSREFKDIRRFCLDTPKDSSIKFPPETNSIWEEQISQFLLLLTVKESAMDVLTNLEARRRIAFFTNSLFLDMPMASPVQSMLSFSVLTPYYSEETIYSKEDLSMENEDGISVLYYLQKIFPDEWTNFLEKHSCNETGLLESQENLMDLRLWASSKGQTLYRTISGMMYYRRALELQAFLDMVTTEEGTSAWYNNKSEGSYNPQLEGVVDLKFTYVLSCQNYGNQRRLGDRRAADIRYLMFRFPWLRVAYINEFETPGEKLFYSVLMKTSGEIIDEVEEIYRIKLPGPVKIGEGKPENQNHALIFTRGEVLQAIDMNQDHYLEEALKMRNLLGEFKNLGVHAPTILGFREHIFTGSVSLLGWFMSHQETSFVTIGQRVLARPLKVRFHYGHPDVFDKLFHITRGGISKASCGINLSEDIFAGFNSILRGGNVTHHEYIQVGKGRDVGFNQIYLFEAKVACGNGEQTLSRDLYRLGQCLDFFRMMSCYTTTIGFYINSMLIVLTVYAFLYGRLYLSLSGVEDAIVQYAGDKGDTFLIAVMASQSVVQFGLLMTLPILMETGLEKGFNTALCDLIIMQVQLAPLFFTFSLGTKVHYYGRTILHGGAKYRATGRGFVVKHEMFAENYRMYSRSHFVKGMELMVLLICYWLYGNATEDGVAYFVMMGSTWFLVLSWLFSPTIFNPSRFEWHKIVGDWDDWNKWISNRGFGVPANKSWETWWEEEQEPLRHSGFLGKFWEIVLSLRFFSYQYGIVYHLNITKQNRMGKQQSFIVYVLSWLVVAAVIVNLKIVSMARKKFSSNFHLMFRLLKLFLFIGYVVILGLLFYFLKLTVGDIFQCLLAFLPTGWGLLQIALVGRQLMEAVWMWETVKALARMYDCIMGGIIFMPITVLAWFPFVSEFQTRLLFNQGFSRGLHIQRIISGGR